MTIENLCLSKEKIDINLNFYFFLKHIVKLKPNYREVNSMIEAINLLKSNVTSLITALEEMFKKNKPKTEQIRDIYIRLITSDDIEVFDFSLRLYRIKDLLLAEAKVSESLDIDKLSELHPLSLEYDKISILKPYKFRVNGALLTLLFFEKLDAGKINFISQDSLYLIEDLAKKANSFKNIGLESNQIFMIMFNESIN